jgi:hypothetical protein
MNTGWKTRFRQIRKFHLALGDIPLMLRPRPADMASELSPQEAAAMRAELDSSLAKGATLTEAARRAAGIGSDQEICKGASA